MYGGSLVPAQEPGLRFLQAEVKLLRLLPLGLKEVEKVLLVPAAEPILLRFSGFNQKIRGGRSPEPDVNGPRYQPRRRGCSLELLAHFNLQFYVNKYLIY